MSFEISNQKYIDLYHDMCRIRKFEQALEREFRRGNVPGMLHVGLGQEATLAAIAHSLRLEDGIFPDHRCHGLLFLKGTPGERIMAELFGKGSGICSGKGGSLHSADASVNNFGDNSIEGSFMVTALGVALGWKMQGKNSLAAVMVGDGTSGRGEWHESMNLASVWKVPLLYCCVNNGYAISTPVGFSHASANLVDFARGYHIPACQVDGNDVTAAYQATQEAVEYIRSGKGPYFVEYKTWRWQGLFSGEFRPPEEVKFWKEEHEPIGIARAELVRRGVPEQDLAVLEKSVDDEIEGWVAFAKSSPAPDPAKATANVYVGWEVEQQ
jgi:pyruvate dehydrogenase E1 component alpha subunit